MLVGRHARRRVGKIVKIQKEREDFERLS